MFRCRKIKGFPNYFVTSEGDVFTNNGRGFKKKKLKKEKNGYLRIDLYYNDGGKFKNVHRLVAEAFILNPESKKQVNHINNVRDDNRVENLEWVTCKENHAHAIKQGRRYWKQGEAQWKSRFTEKDVLQMREFYAQGHSQTKIALLFSTYQSVIGNIVNRKRWKHI